MSELACKSVLDVGSAEGLIAKACLDAGASVVHGIEIDAARAAKARGLCQDKARFFVADLDSDGPNIEEAELLPVYDCLIPGCASSLAAFGPQAIVSTTDLQMRSSSRAQNL